jgi:beta-glucosidase
LVSCKITNTGPRAGDEVAQLYVHQETASVVTPVKALKGFLRIHLKPEESKTVTFHLKQSELAVWNASQQWQVEPGEYMATVGRDSTDGLSAKFTLK